MRIHIGAIPSNDQFKPTEEKWRPLKEPGPVLMQVVAAPIAVVTGVVLGVTSYWIGLFKVHSFELVWLLFAFVGVIPLHELIHLLAHPQQGRSEHSIVGFWPSKGLFYAHYDHILTRNRLLLILVMPLLTISIVPLMVCSVSGFGSLWVAVLSNFNGVLSCGDLFFVLIVSAQVPRDAVVRNQGYYTWWRCEYAKE